MISHLLIYLIAFIAAFFNAMMDTLKDHFSSSIWWNKNPFFYNPSISWKGKKHLGMVWDAWHIAKTIWLLLMITDVYLVSCLNVQLYWFEVISIYMISHGGGFYLGYDLIFKRK